MRLFDSIDRIRKLALVLPSLTLGLGVAVRAQEPVLDVVTSVESVGDQLVAAAVVKLLQHDSVSAKIRHRIDLFGKQLFGSGSYFQQQMGDQTMLRLELKIRLEGQVTSFQQISDGRFLWVRRHVDGDPQISRIDMRRVREQLAQQHSILSAGQGETPMHLGGVPELMRRLTESFRFGPPRPAKLRGDDVWAIGGGLKSHPFADHAPDDSGRIERRVGNTVQTLPAHFPHRVMLFVGKEDLFPYRFDFYRANSTGASKDQPMLVVEIFDVRIGEPLNPKLFAYRPPAELEVKDETEQYLQQFAKIGRPTANR